MDSRVALRGYRNEHSPASTAAQKKRGISEELGETAFEGRFKATRMWNGVMKRFRNGMPLKRHRKMMFAYDDSFSGREATDFLMNELPKFYSESREITRSNCHMLLEKFMNAGLFVPVRGSANDCKEPFRENEVYRFSDVPVEKVAATPMLVRRAASFNERCSFGSSTYGKDGSRMARFQRRDDIHAFGENMLPAISALPTVRSPTLAKSRRLSSSHGNLPSMLSPRIFDSVETMASTRAQIDYDMKELDEENFMDAGKNTDDKENGSPLDEVISELQKVGNPVASMNATLRSFGKIVQTAAVDDEISPDKPPAMGGRRIICTSRPRLSPVRLKRSPQSDSSAEQIWKDALLARLTEVLHVESLNGVVEADFSGYDVKWNCEKVGIKGIVRVKNEDDDLSTYLIAMMRYLTRWPFDQKFVEKVAAYPGMERNVFENVCEHFSKGRPILPSPAASAILNIVRVIRARSLHQSETLVYSDEKVQETDASNEDTPITRYVNVLKRGLERRCNIASPEKSTDCSEDFSRCLGTRNNAIAANSSKGDKGKTAEGVSADSILPLRLLDADNNFVRTDHAELDKRYDSIFVRLPGLQRSPELLVRLEELSRVDVNDFVTSPPSCSKYSPSSFQTARLGLSPLITNIAQDDEADLIESVSLVLLTLPPSIRRRLHYLLRFMEKICKNHCLRLSPHQENRYVVFERLSESVLHASGSISSVQSLHLVAFLVDNQEDVFTVPETLRKEVENLTAQSQEEKMKRQYCEPIQKREYDEQKDAGVEGHLLNLLDSIVRSENISTDERRKQLKKFKKTYPVIYSKRFPSPKLKNKKARTPSFLDRLRNLNFR